MKLADAPIAFLWATIMAAWMLLAFDRIEQQRRIERAQIEALGIPFLHPPIPTSLRLPPPPPAPPKPKNPQQLPVVPVPMTLLEMD